MVSNDEATEPPGVRLSERVIPVPRSISPQARAALVMERPPALPTPPLDDKPAWRRYVEQVNTMWAPVLAEMASGLNCQVELHKIGGIPTFVIDPPSVPAKNKGKANLFAHGGALVVMGGECAAQYATVEAVETRCRVYAPDFRNPPDHPYPAALHDCVAVYRELLNTHAPADIVITGSSGGGNLAAAMPLEICELGLPMPAAVGLFTPEVDLTQSGDTFATNRDIDVVLVNDEMLSAMIDLYADGHDLSDPKLSPIFADFSKGYPPTFLQSGTRDLFLSNTVRMHRALRRAGIDAELHVAEALPHGFFGNAPEDQDLREEFRRFLARTAGFAR